MRNLFFLFFLILPTLASKFHIKELDEKWELCNVRRNFITKWALKSQIDNNLNTSNTTIFYPLGGGDIIFPLSFFPFAKKIIIMGLEKPGKGFLKEDREAIIKNLGFFLEHGYFVTLYMQELSKSGILGIILVQLKTIGASNIKLDVKEKALSIKFLYQNKKRKIKYIKTDLHNSNFKNWIKLFQNLKNFTLMVKSASYVLQQKGFEKIRDELLNRAKIILQDDTGISHDMLVKSNFQYRMYGFYDFPSGHPSFKAYFQATLKEAYAKESLGLLNFAIGYGKKIKQSNLTWYFKKN